MVEWHFTDASGTLGWVPAEPLAECRIRDGVLSVEPGPGIPKLESPLFDIQANPWQFVEIEMKTDTGGTGLVYYSNTTQEPYHGFRTGQYATFEAAPDGEYHTYTVYPFWHRQGRIIHIRVDPPGNKVAIRRIRIVEIPAGEHSSQTEWDFREGTHGWASAKLDFEKHRGGVILTGDRTSVFFSPLLDADASNDTWATVRVSSGRNATIMFRWVSDKTDGLHMLPIEVRGGRIPRSYTIDLAGLAAWTGRILAIGITPTDSADSRTVLLERISIGSTRTGPAEPRIVNLRVAEPFVRAGDRVRLACEVSNEGGASARDLVASARMTVGCRTVYLPSQMVTELAPGQTARLEWMTQAAGEDFTFEARLSGPEVHCEERTLQVRVYPALEKRFRRRFAYVPAPQAADTGEYLVGAYYYPGWHNYERWSVLNNFPERRPLLGYYREGSSEVADWHIKWAKEHGISFFIYDWYWDRGRRQLEHALHDGLFESRYGNTLKFCLLWANHNPTGSHSASDLEAVTRYWIENYFSRPNYLKIGGKNVVVIFNPYGLTSDMGSAAVRSSFEKMREMCETAGVGGLYLVACSYPGRDRIKLIESEGYDAISGYNYPSAGSRGQRVAPYEWMVDGYREFWCEIADATSLPYIPVCEPGWDARPWHGMNSLVRTGKNPDLWKKMLEYARQFVDDPTRKKPEGQKLIFLEAWNEFGEGDYIEPHAQWGFDYLEAVREVFAPDTPKPVAIVPRDIGLGPYEVNAPKSKTSWDFRKPEYRSWAPGNMSEASYKGGVLHAISRNSDPMIFSPKVSIDASKYRSIEFRLKLSAGSEAQVFFSRAREQMSEEKSVRIGVKADGKFHTYKVDLAANPHWRGLIEAVRLDPTDAEAAQIELAYVRFR